MYNPTPTEDEIVAAIFGQNILWKQWDGSPISTLPRPVSLALPIISGPAPPRVGQQLSGSDGIWWGPPPSIALRRWQINGGSAVSGTYTPVAADVGRTINFSVVAANAAGQSVATSTPTLPVEA